MPQNTAVMKLLRAVPSDDERHVIAGAAVSGETLGALPLTLKARPMK